MNLSTKNWPLSKTICWVFVILYAISIHYNGYIQYDETEYFSIAKSIAHAGDFAIYHKPSIIIPVWPFILSLVTSLSSDPKTSIFLGHILSAIFTIANIFLITAFLRKIKTGGTPLSEAKIALIQLLTFGNIYLMSSAGNLYPENISISIFFLLLLTIYSEFDVYKAAFAGILFAGLALNKYVAIPIVAAFPVYYIYRFGWKKKTFAYSIISVVFASIIIVPFFMRMQYINTHHLSDFSYLKNLTGRYHATGMQLYLLSIQKGFECLILRFQELFTTLNKSTHLPHVNIIFSALSVIFLVPIFKNIIRLIKTGEILEYTYLFSILFMGGLILVGTGFTRYWLLILPLLNLMFIEGLFSFKIFQKPILTNLNLKPWVLWGSLAVLFLAGIYARFIVKDVWSIKSAVIVISFIGTSLIAGFLYSAVNIRTLGAFLVFCLIIWSNSRSIGQNPIMHNPANPKYIAEEHRQTEILDFMKTLPMDSSTAFVVPTYKVWMQTYANWDFSNEYALSDIRYHKFYLCWWPFLNDDPAKKALFTIRPWDKKLIYDKNDIQIYQLTDMSK